MSKLVPLTAIDLGTDKCTTLIALCDREAKTMRVVGAAAVPSRGVRKSVIVDLEQALETITESLDAAERMAGFDVKSAYVSVSGAHVTSLNSKGVVAVATPNQEIVAEDVARVIEAARAISLPSDREIIHVVARNFKVDSQDGIKDPVGMTGVRLESEAHIITGMATALRNLEKCLRDVGLHCDGFVFAGLAAAEVTVSETEKELGVAVVEMGAGTTSLCVFSEGSLIYSASLPIGARHITQDIALGCRVSLDAAEKIKLALSLENEHQLTPHPGESKEELNKRRKKADILDVTKLGIEESVEILSKRSLIEGIMVPRMKEIFTMIGKHLDAQQLIPLIPAGLVISGGGAETVGLTEVAKRVLQIPARVGKPQELQGLATDITRPAFAVPIGLLLYGRRHAGPVLAPAGFSLEKLLPPLKLSKLTSGLTKFMQMLWP